MDFSVCLGMMAVIISWICSKIMIETENNGEKFLTIAATLPAAGYAILKALGRADDAQHSLLNWLQIHWGLVCISMFVFALLPPIFADREWKEEEFRADENYMWKNRLYNLAGAVSACALWWIAITVIDDIRCLRTFPIEGIISVLVPMCMGMVQIYQKIEMRNKNLDHDASAKWLNQKLNMWHLFWVYLWVLISVMFIVSYTIYCHIHQRELVMKWSYYVFLTLMLVFFYLLSQHPYDYLRLIFVVMVPVILIASTYWMSWFAMSRCMRWMQWGFMVLHSLLYAGCYYVQGVRNKKKQYEDTNDGAEESKERIDKSFWEKSARFIKNHAIIVGLGLVIVIMYALVWLAPLNASRMTAQEMNNYIKKICQYTDVKETEIIDKLNKTSVYDSAENNYDIEAFLIFVSQELLPQLLEKEIIKNKDDVLTYGRLKDWYVKAP